MVESLHLTLQVSHLVLQVLCPKANRNVSRHRLTMTGHKWRRVAKGTRIEECRRALEEGRLQGTRADSPPLTPPPTPPDMTLISPSEMLNRYQLTSALNYHLVLGEF